MVVRTKVALLAVLFSLVLAPAAYAAQSDPVPATFDPTPPTPQDRPAPKARSKDFERFGVEIGGFGPTGGRTAIPDRRIWGSIGITYRLQARGKRTLFQPDVYVDVARNYLPPTFALGTDDTSGMSVNRPSLYSIAVGTGRGFWGLGVSTRSVAIFFAGVQRRLSVLEEVFTGWKLSIISTSIVAPIPLEGTRLSALTIGQPTPLSDRAANFLRVCRIATDSTRPPPCTIWAPSTICPTGGFP